MHVRRDETRCRVRVLVVAVPAIHSIQALCLSVASFSLNNDISRFSRSSLTTASVSLTKLSRSFPPATLFDFLACLPAYNLIHSAAHDSTVSPRAHHHHHYHQHPPPPALPTAHETLRLLLPVCHRRTETSPLPLSNTNRRAHHSTLSWPARKTYCTLHSADPATAAPPIVAIAYCADASLPHRTPTLKCCPRSGHGQGVSRP